MAAKGSRKNPYTLSEFNHLGSSWTGGWVLFGTIKKYVDSNDGEYNSTLGSLSNPCSMFMFLQNTTND